MAGGLTIPPPLATAALAGPAGANRDSSAAAETVPGANRLEATGIGELSYG